MNDATLQASMVAAIGTSITGARAVGKPDPTDDDLRYGLAAAGFATIDISELLPRMKALALEAIHTAAELAALMLFLAAGGVWAGLLRGIV